MTSSGPFQPWPFSISVILSALFCSKHALDMCSCNSQIFFSSLYLWLTQAPLLFTVSVCFLMQTKGCPAATLAVCFNVHSSSASCFIQTSSKEDERKHRPQWFTQIIKCLLYNQWKIICLPHQRHYSYFCRKINLMKNEFQPCQHLLLLTIEQWLEMKEV